MGTLAGFLGYVNYRNPFLGKSLDYLMGAGRKGDGLLQITMPEGTTVCNNVVSGRVNLERYAKAFFGVEVGVEILQQPAFGSELHLFPVDNSKLWNQIAFFLPFSNSGCDDLPGVGVGALVVGKKEYRILQKDFNMAMSSGEIKKLLAELAAEFFLADDLALMVDRVVPRAQKRRGIVHLVTLCKNEREFLGIDYTCSRIKESGTPGHEGPLQVRSLLGRLHAVFPGQFCAGLSIVHKLAS